MSKRMKKSEIVGYNAIDVTEMQFDEMEKLRKSENGFEKIGYSFTNTSGLSSILFKGRETEKLYKVTKRSSSMFYFW